MTARSERPKRKRRVASDEAHAWARDLKLGNPNAKSVLRAAALYVNDEGSCIAGIPTLAYDCDLSPDTVRSRLKFLEEIGAIVRLPRWRDENGRENTEGRGKRTTDDIRLMIDADIEEIEARARGETPTDDVADGEHFSPGPQQGLNPDADDGVSPRPVPPSGLGQPSDSRKGLISEPEPEPEELPQPPPGVSVAPDGWKEFQEDWQEPILRQSMAQQVWQALSAEERTLARQAARGYVAWRKRQTKPPNVLGAHLFLKERDAWPRFAAHAPDMRVTAPSGYEPESVEGQAITALYALARTSPMLIGHGTLLCHKGELTPQVLALATAGGHSGWPWIEDRQQIAAWSAFIHEHLGRSNIMASRGIGENARRGIYAPWPWPPRKDGTLSQAGPDTLMSEQDFEDFASEGTR